MTVGACQLVPLPVMRLTEQALSTRRLEFVCRSGVEQLAVRRAHNPEVEGSSPSPATTHRLTALPSLG